MANGEAGEREARERKEKINTESWKNKHKVQEGEAF